MPAPTPGIKVRFTANNLGLVRGATQHYFESETVREGDEGIYETPHPTLGEEDWHIVKVGKLLCPCHRSQFEVVD